MCELVFRLISKTTKQKRGTIPFTISLRHTFVIKIYQNFSLDHLSSLPSTNVLTYEGTTVQNDFNYRISSYSYRGNYSFGQNFGVHLFVGAMERTKLGSMYYFCRPAQRVCAMRRKLGH